MRQRRDDALLDRLNWWSGRDGAASRRFIAASAEFHRLEEPIHRMAASQERRMSEGLEQSYAAAGARRPGALALRLHHLFCRAIVQAQTCGPDDVRMDAARRTVGMLIAPSSACTGTG